MAPFPLVAVLLTLAVSQIAAYHGAEQQLGRKPHDHIGKTYSTAHGHEMPQHRYDDCFAAAIKACQPHREASHDTYQRNAPISQVYRCLQRKPHLLPKKCHEWAAGQTGCVDDIESLCPHMSLWKTFLCIEDKYDQLSAECRDSEWYKHQFPHDHARVSTPRHHHDDEFEESVETEAHHHAHDHGYDVSNDDAFSDL